MKRAAGRAILPPMFRPRSTAHRRGGSRLVWQVLFIVPPVIILSVVALYSLRQDHASIEQGARKNASVLAPDLARRWGVRASTELAALIASACSGGGLEAHSAVEGGSEAALMPMCGLVVNGRIRVPLDYPPLPSPPEWVRSLPPAEAQPWRQVADASPRTDSVTLRRAAAVLAGADRPVRANAEWILLRAEVNRNAASNAAERLIEFADRSADVLSESGTPLSDLAMLLALRHVPAGGLSDALLQDLRRRVVEYPSFLTAELVAEADRVGGSRAAGIRARWVANERALSLLRRLPIRSEQRATSDEQRDHPSEVWLDDAPSAWVAFVHPLVSADATGGPMARTAYQVTLLPSRLIERMFQAAAGHDGIPDYAAATIRLGDGTWRVGAPGPKSAGAAELASASGQIDLPLAVPADTVATFAGELLRIAPQAISARQPTPGGAIRLNGVPGAHAFTVGLDLADPDRLYASYRLRLWMAVGLILVTTFAVLGGLAGTWRAFERERQLGEMKSNFVASVSHELRAPIAAMRLMTESLERGTIEGGDRQREYFRVIGQECRRLSALVENVLDFSRIDRGRTQYTFEPADLEALVSRTIELMRPYAAERQVTLVSASGPAGGELGRRRVDREALQQALMNLVDNAIKHSPAGAEVVVGLEAEPSTVRLSVDDHGSGIPAAEQARIFEPFYRRGSELRRETAGIGIGLSIAKHIVEAHGGRIVVGSDPGSGSRFTIELPVPMEPAS
jgi:signal transduction histidine kinase